MEKVTGLALKPCPHCGEELVLHTDHHGSWWAHRDEPARCAHGVTQIFDEDDAEEWNRREELSAERDAIANNARRIAGLYSEGSDGRNTFIILAEWIEARKSTPHSPTRGGAL